MIPHDKSQPLSGWRILLNVVGVLGLTWILHAVFGQDATDSIILANVFLTPDLITKEALRVLTNNRVFSSTINHTYDEKFFRMGAKNGDRVRVRKPPRYRGRTGAAMQPEAITETFIYVTLDIEFGVDMEVSNFDLALSLTNFSEKCLKTPAARIANYVDQRALELAAQTTPYSVGTPGTTPNALLTFGLAAEKLDSNAAPRDDQRWITISSMMEVTIMDAVKSLFHASDAITQQYKSGRMGRALGFTWQMDQNVFSRTNGQRGGTPLVNGANQTGASLITDGWTAAAANRVRRGDRFTVGVNHINPMSYMSNNQLQQFVATADGDSDGAGALTLSIAPSIVVAGSGQTVTASPDNDAALTFVGAASQVGICGFAHHKDALAFASADLPMPGGVDMGGLISDEETGVAIRYIRDFETRSGQWLTRLDLIFGVADLRNDSLGVVIYS